MVDKIKTLWTDICDHNKFAQDQNNWPVLEHIRLNVAPLPLCFYLVDRVWAGLKKTN